MLLLADKLQDYACTRLTSDPLKHGKIHFLRTTSKLKCFWAYTLLIECDSLDGDADDLLYVEYTSHGKDIRSFKGFVLR